MLPNSFVSVSLTISMSSAYSNKNDFNQILTNRQQSNRTDWNVLEPFRLFHEKDLLKLHVSGFFISIVIADHEHVNTGIVRFSLSVVPGVWTATGNHRYFPVETGWSVPHSVTVTCSTADRQLNIYMVNLSLLGSMSPWTHYRTRNSRRITACEIELLVLSF